MATPQVSPTQAGPNRPGSPSFGYVLVVALAKLVGAAVVLVAFVVIGALAGLGVSGFACDGGVIGEGCSSNNATGGWIVFGLFTAAGGVLAILTLLPQRLRHRLMHPRT